tara:strand:+ start:85 stop:498 length:414 start_codon:yes stop_codon:yes gene_type:complete
MIAIIIISILLSTTGIAFGVYKTCGRFDELNICVTNIINKIRDMILSALKSESDKKEEPIVSEPPIEILKVPDMNIDSEDFDIDLDNSPIITSRPKVDYGEMKKILGTDIGDDEINLIGALDAAFDEGESDLSNEFN